MITALQRLTKNLKASHATKERSHASQDKDDLQGKQIEDNLHKLENWSNRIGEFVDRITSTVSDFQTNN